MKTPKTNANICEAKIYVAVSDDGNYMVGADTDYNAQDIEFWADQDDISRIELWQVPEGLDDSLIFQGTEDQEFSDGYEAYDVLKSKGKIIDTTYERSDDEVPSEDEDHVYSEANHKSLLKIDPESGLHTQYKGFKSGDVVTVKHPVSVYGGDGVLEPGTKATIFSFAEKVRMAPKSQSTDGLPYFAVLDFFVDDQKKRASANIANIQKAAVTTESRICESSNDRVISMFVANNLPDHKTQWGSERLFMKRTEFGMMLYYRVNGKKIKLAFLDNDDDTIYVSMVKPKNIRMAELQNMLTRTAKTSGIVVKPTDLDRLESSQKSHSSEPVFESGFKKNLVEEMVDDFDENEEEETEDNNYPDQYLLVTEEQSGERYIMPIADDEPWDLEKLVDKWLVQEYSGELMRDGKISRLPGEFYASIITDGRPPDSALVWSAGGFYTKITYEG